MAFVNGIAKSQWPFSPQCLPNCLLWLDAADTNTYVSGSSSITSWRNKGFAAGSAAGVGGSIVSTTINGIPSLSFGAYSNIIVPPMTFTQTTRTVFTVQQLGAVSNIVLYQNTVDSNSFSIYYDGAGVLVFQGGASTYIYRTNSLASVFNNITITCFTQPATSSTGGIFINGTAGNLISGGSPTYSFPTGTSSNQSIGWPSTAAFTLGETMIFDGAISDIQRQQVEGYLAAKWGLRPQLPQTHPYFSPVITSTLSTSLLSPTSIASCQLWLDAADQSTVIVSGLNGGVTAWNDKSGAGNTMTVGTGTTTYTRFGPGPSIKLNSSYLACTGKNINLSSMSVFVVSLSQVAESDKPLLIGIPTTYSDTGAPNGFGIYLSSNLGSQRADFVYDFPVYISNSIASTIPLAQPLNLQSYTVGSNGNGNSWINGVVGNSISGYTRTSGTAGFAIGASYTVAGSVFSNISTNANVYEILVYNSVLSTSDRQAVEGYLMSKWGCGRNLSMDASDTTTIPAASTITSLPDKSGTGNTSTITGSPTLQQIAGRPYIYLNGTSWFTGPVSITGTTLTTFAVISIPANSGAALNPRIISLGIPTAYDYNNTGYAAALYIPPNSKTINTFRSNAIRSSFANISSAPIIASSIYNGTNGTVYLNGVAGTAGANISDTFAITHYGIGIDVNPSDGEYFVGYIGEVIIYNTALTATQRQQVETYIGNKWGIGIPTPTSGVTAPTDIAGCKLWLDAYSAGVPISTINDKSGNGRTATSGGTANPILTPYGINGRPAMYFANPTGGSGTPSYFLSGAMSLTGTSASTFIVCTPTLSVTGGNPRILSFGDGTANTDFGQATLGLPLDQENAAFNAYRNSTNVGGVSITPGTPYIMDTIFTGTTISLYKNGATPATAVYGSLTFSVNKYTLACYSASTSALFNGYIGEVIIYNTALTDTQRQQVETYLGAKWGIAVANPTSAITAPTDIAGCQLWLDATSSISQINDKTGNGYNLTQSTTVNQPTLSNNYLNFGTAANLYMNMPAAAINNATAWTMFLVINPNSSINWIMAKQVLASTATNTLSTTYYSKFAFGSTNPAQGITNRLYFRGLDVSGSPIILSQPQLITLRYDGSIMSYYVNGTLSASTTNSFEIPNVLSPDTSTLGAWVSSNGTYNNSGQTNFALGELDFYRSALSTTLIQQIGLYIMNKWNITPTTSSFSPTSIPVCVLWLDAADTATYNTSSFTTWTNKGTAGGSTGSKSGTITSSTINGTSALSFAASAGIIYPGANITYTSTTRTVFVVATIGASGTSTDYFFMNNANSLQDVTVQIRGSAAGGLAGISFWSGNSAVVYQVNPTPTGIFNTASVFCGTSSTTNGGIFVNGTKISSGSPTNQFSTGANGGQTIGLAGATAAFTLGEVIIFDGAITDAQRQQVNNYLQQKWNIGSTNTPINNRPFAPVDISGCGLWLDAADVSTISGTTWSDKSGGGYNVTSTNNITRTSAGITINEVANNVLTNASIPIPTSYSLFAVGQTTSASVGGTYYRLVNIAPDVRGFLGTLGSSYATFAGIGSAWNDVTANTPTRTLVPNTQYVMEMIINGSVLTPYFNGTAQNTKTGTTIASTGIIIGNFSGGQVWNGNVAEVILYNTVLTNSQRLQVESYLAQKWGISSSLPTTHPGYTLPAFSTVFTPKSIGSMQLWLDAADTSTLVTSGTSVVAWRDKSGLNNTMNVLPGAPPGYTVAYPVIGTPINNGNTVYFSPAAGLKQPTVLSGVKNFYWVGRISNSGENAINGAGAYMMLGHDTQYYWHGNIFTTPPNTLLNSIYAAAGIRSATPASLYTTDTGSAAVNTTFGTLNMPVNNAIHLISVAGITGVTDYQGICYDRDSANIGWCGDLAEVIIFTSALSTYQHRQVEGYLAWKWGLHAQLPTTHPYYKLRP